MKHAFLEEESTRRKLSQFILDAPRLSMGEQCEAFEREFSAYQGRSHSILFNSGGSANLALLQALKNLGALSDEDAVGFSAVTWSTNVMPILQLGMTPVAVDCDPSILNTTADQLRRSLSKKKLQAFFATNVLGFLPDLDEIRRICDEHDVLLLEDNCESLGSEIETGKAGNFSLAATFSFYVAHHMSTIEGGMVCTDDAELATMLRIVRANGWDRNLAAETQQVLRAHHGIRSGFHASYSFYELGFNLRPTEITGFLGRVQLGHLETSISKRIQNFQRVMRATEDNPDFRKLRWKDQKVLSSFALPFICTSTRVRDKYLVRLVREGIEHRPIIAGNMQRQPFYLKYVEVEETAPGADVLHDCGFYIGNYPELDDDDLEIIIRCLTGT